jgi:hypothetical protein
MNSWAIAETMNDNLPICFRASFFQTLCAPEHAAALKEAALAGRLGQWTRVLTSVSVEACREMGWQASAKGHHAQLLPVSRGEYLNLDVMAFGPGESRWHFPLAIMELENQTREDFIAYSLWKLLSVGRNCGCCSVIAKKRRKPGRSENTCRSK